MPLDWKNIIATFVAALAGGLGSYVLAAFFQSIDRRRRRVEDFEREWHSEELRQSKDALYSVLANHNTRHLERVMELLRRMAVCWREAEVHRHYFIRLLGHDARQWQALFNKIEVPNTNYWKSYFDEIRSARFE